MIDFYFKYVDLIDQIFTHFFSHYIFYFFLILNFFIIRFFKYSIDNNNNIVRNFKNFENNRVIIDSVRLNFHLDVIRLHYYFIYSNRIELCLTNTPSTVF